MGDVISCEQEQGMVKWFNNQKGYGFITIDDQPDIFVHHTAIVMDGYRTLQEGDVVEFELTTTSKGLQAQNVQRASASATHA